MTCPELSEAWAFKTQVSVLCASMWTAGQTCTLSSQPAPSPSEEGSRCLT